MGESVPIPNLAATALSGGAPLARRIPTPEELAVTMDESRSLQQADRLLAAVQDEERQEHERQLGDPEDVGEPDELDPPDPRVDAARSLIQGVMWNVNSDPEDVLKQTAY